MYKLTFKYPLKDAETATEKLYIKDIYNVFYESPLTITTDDNGYGFYENIEELIDYNVIVESDDLNEVNSCINTIKETLLIDSIYSEKVEVQSFENEFEPLDLNNGWIFADPEYNVEDKKKINFIPQGAFGTGLHETTQDCLRYILSQDFTNLTGLDIGAGSGILSLAAAAKNAKLVTAVDIRDVTEEVMFNASLNNFNNIEVTVGNLLEENLLKKTYDFIVINIGGDETLMFMDFITNHLNPKGKLLVSGLVEWSFDKVKSKVESYGFTLDYKVQSAEWCTATFLK